MSAPDLGFGGGYVEAGWNITGDAAFARPTFDRPFTIDERGIGVWQPAARYSAGRSLQPAGRVQVAW